ncbi:MAG: hydrogenase small subunit [Candidatus Methylomirabilales bacterium]
MKVSRRDFLRLVTASSAALALDPLDLFRLREALANPGGPTILWLQGSGCTGCSISFLNYISTAAPADPADVLIETVDLAYHPNLMAAAGESAVAVAHSVAAKGGYILAVEGGIPTAFGGAACWAWSEGGRDVTFLEATRELAARAAVILSIGTCAAYGGVSAAAPNPTGVMGVGAALGKSTLNIPGCPPHPDWIVWAIAKLLTGSVGALDSNGRPAALFSKTVHEQCPRRGTSPAGTYGVDGHCLKTLGCKGPRTKATCPISLWNGRTNWCVDANGLCIACTEPTFPFTSVRRDADA